MKRIERQKYLDELISLKENGMIKSNCRYRFTATTEGLLVSVSGEIDHHSAVEFRECIDSAVKVVKPSTLTLDFSGNTVIIEKEAEK